MWANAVQRNRPAMAELVRSKKCIVVSKGLPIKILQEYQGSAAVKVRLDIPEQTRAMYIIKSMVG